MILPVICEILLLILIDLRENKQQFFFLSFQFPLSNFLISLSDKNTTRIRTKSEIHSRY